MTVEKHLSSSVLYYSGIIQPVNNLAKAFFVRDYGTQLDENALDVRFLTLYM